VGLTVDAVPIAQSQTGGSAVAAFAGTVKTVTLAATDTDSANLSFSIVSVPAWDAGQHHGHELHAERCAAAVPRVSITRRRRLRRGGQLHLKANDTCSTRRGDGGRGVPARRSPPTTRHGDGNVHIASAVNVLSNDTLRGATITKLNGVSGSAPFSGTISQGGSVTLNADGSFSYNPTAGSPAATIPFTYTLANGASTTSTGTCDDHGQQHDLVHQMRVPRRR